MSQVDSPFIIIALILKFHSNYTITLHEVNLGHSSASTVEGERQTAIKMTEVKLVLSDSLNCFILIVNLLICFLLAAVLRKHFASIPFIRRNILTYLSNFLVFHQIVVVFSMVN